MPGAALGSDTVFERWLAAREAAEARRAWAALGARAREIAPADRTLTLHGAALLAGDMLGERADWIVDVSARHPESQTSGAVDGCFVENAWDVHERAHATWSVHERGTGARGVQVVLVGVGSLHGQPDGSSEIVVRVFDRDRAVSVHIGSNRAATIGEVDLAPLDVLWFSRAHEVTSPGRLVEHLLAELHHGTLPWGHVLEATWGSIHGRLPSADIDRVLACLRAGVEPPSAPDTLDAPRAPAPRAEKVWEWDFADSFNPRYDAAASPEGLSYGCEIQGPFCGYDAVGSQTWDDFLAVGPPARVHMPAPIAAEIRAHALARRGGT